MRMDIDFDTDASGDKTRVTGVLRIRANEWDRGQFECQVNFAI